MESSKPRGDLGDWERREPLVSRITKVKSLQIALKVQGIKKIAENRIIAKASMRQMMPISGPNRKVIPYLSRHSKSERQQIIALRMGEPNTTSSAISKQGNRVNQRTKL